MTIEMSKRVEKVVLQMRKHNIPDTLRAQLEFALDTSVSAIWMYNNGTMQELVERIMAVGLRLDADGKLGMTSFGSSACKHKDVTEADIAGYIQNRFIQESKTGGSWETGTNYAVGLGAMLGTDIADKAKSAFGKFTSMFKAKAVNYPKFNIFVSDGQDGGSRSDFEKLMSDRKDTDYFMLVGVGSATYFTMMKEVAEKYDNVGFVHFNDLSISDDTMYEMILAKEALDWLLARQPQ